MAAAAAASGAKVPASAAAAAAEEDSSSEEDEGEEEEVVVAKPFVVEESHKKKKKVIALLLLEPAPNVGRGGPAKRSGNYQAASREKQTRERARRISFIELAVVSWAPLCLPISLQKDKHHHKNSD